MRKQYVDFLMYFHSRKNSKFYKTISIICGLIFFLYILPLIFIWIGLKVDAFYSINGNPVIKYVSSVLSIVFGLFFLVWATLTQFKVGKGTPAPNAPTEKLVISGPYRHTRNPIELGAIFYYFGLGTLIYSYTVGFVCFLLGFIIGSIYHKYVEEKELEARFGDDYKEYKKRVPFLIPRLKEK